MWKQQARTAIASRAPRSFSVNAAPPLYNRIVNRHHIRAAHSVSKLSPLFFDPQLRRCQNASWVIGRVKEDEAHYDEEMKKLRNDAATAVRDRDVEGFIQVAHSTIRHLGTINASHPLALHPKQSFFDHPSPVRPVLDVMLGKAFNKACDVLDPREACLNNNSGRAIYGDRGVGKTNCALTCTIVVPLLLDNVISVYIDYSLNPPTPSNTPYELILTAWRARGLNVESCAKVGPSFDSLKGRAFLSGMSIMFIADELQNVYSDDTIWAQLNGLASTHVHSLFVLDSSSRLRTLVEGNNRPLIAQLSYSKPQPSLNETRLTLVQMPPITTIEQYHSYFAQLKKPIPSTSEIIGMHMVTGGRMRHVAQLVSRVVGESQPITYLKSLPSSKSFAHMVLYKLYRSVVGDAYHPFSTHQPTISITELAQLHAKQAEAQPFKMALLEMLDTGVLREVERGIYTFGIPSHYQALAEITPKVFLSYALRDDTATSALHKCAQTLEQTGMHVQHCRLPDAMEKMSELGVHNWMALEALSCSTPNHHAIVYLGEGYHKQAAAAPSVKLASLPTSGTLEEIRQYVGDYIASASKSEKADMLNGCSFELSLMAALAERLPSAMNRISFISPDTKNARTLLRDPRYKVFSDVLVYRPQDVQSLALKIIGQHLEKPVPAV